MDGRSTASLKNSLANSRLNVATAVAIRHVEDAPWLRRSVDIIAENASSPIVTSVPYRHSRFKAGRTSYDLATRTVGKLQAPRH